MGRGVDLVMVSGDASSIAECLGYSLLVLRRVKVCMTLILCI